MNDLRAETCCFTGHRDVPRCDEQKILTRVNYILKPLLAQGVKYFGVGGSTGFDMFVAEYMLDRRDRLGEKIKIISVLPFPEYREGWGEEEIRRQDRIIARSDKVIYASPANCKDVYLIRDRRLVDGSCYCISYCRRRTGGTAYTIRYAMKKGLQVFNAGSWDINLLRTPDTLPGRMIR